MARQDKKDLRLAVAVNIRSKMGQAGIRTLAELATLARISPSMVSDILNGKTSPRVDTIQRIAEAVCCPAHELFADDPKSIPAYKDELFMVLYSRFTLASESDKALVRRLLLGE